MDDLLEDESLTQALAFIAVDSSSSEEEDDDEMDSKVSALTSALPAIRRVARKVLASDSATTSRKKPKKFNYERAMLCVQEDYLGPDPLFDGYFERVFRVTRQITERVIQIVGNATGFFRRSKNKVTGEPGIYPEVKVLMAMKQLAYGVSPSAFMDYFQMSDTYGRMCLKELCKVVANSELRDIYLRQMTRSDARKVSNIHEVEFGVAGCIGCLDCMHVYWRTCPVAWQGQFEGKDGSPSIVLEAVADYRLWLWYARFGFPGTLNDINIWDQSKLLKQFLDGTFTADIDFPFFINNEEFYQVWLLVDGIYPELSRFVKTLSVPITKQERNYSKWQEGKRKSVERAFGVLQRKFQFLVRPVELLFTEDIQDIVEACIIFHNMMVEVRVLRDQDEDSDWYDVPADNVPRSFTRRNRRDGTATVETPPVVEGRQPTARERLAIVQAQWPDAHNNQQRTEEVHRAIREHFAYMNYEWLRLYNRARHCTLRTAILHAIQDEENDDN